MGKTNKGDKTKTTQGKGGSSKQGSKKTGGGIPVEKMRFVPGENQAENYQRLIEHQKPTVSVKMMCVAFVSAGRRTDRRIDPGH